MTFDPKEALERLKEALADLQSHRSSWRDGLEIALRHAPTPGVDHDDPSYWRHELAVFDRVFAQVPVLIAEREGLEAKIETYEAEEGAISVLYANERVKRQAAEAKFSALEGAAQNFVVVAHSSSQSGDRFWEACDALEKLCSTPAALLHPTVPVERDPIKAAYKQGWGDREDDLILGAARLGALIKVDSVRALVAAVSAFLADEDEMMEKLLAAGKRLEDFGFPFPRVVEIRSALAALSVAPPSQGMETLTADFARSLPGGKPTGELCGDCPPVGYITDKTRCLPCPRRGQLATNPGVLEGSTSGWVLVPIEPTEEMVAAHYDAHATAKTVFASAEDVWAAMVAAFQSHKGGEGDSELAAADNNHRGGA